jgi:predicted RNA-binding Zn ribbon-like protein
MRDQTPETRPKAAGELGVLQEFLNSGHLNAATLVAPAARDEIRRRHAAGDSQALLASEFGLNQGFVSAIVRRAPLDDELHSPEAAQRWLAARDLLPPDTPLGEPDVALLRELRELLRHLAAANNGHALEPTALESLDRIAASAPLVFRFGSPPEPTLQPIGTAANAATAFLLALLYRTIRDGRWQRLKRCPGIGCPFTFYDAARNRTGTWCAMSICGNRTKVRNYQKRKRVARAVSATGVDPPPA